MKNKKYIIKLFAVALLMMVQSCSKDFLDEVPSNQQSPESIQLIADALVVLNGAYDLMQHIEFLQSNTVCRNDVRADDMQTPERGRLADEYTYNFDTENVTNYLWERPYMIIRHVNNILAVIDDIPANNIAEETTRDDIKGQALAIRALAHFHLCNFFGYPYSHDGGASLGVPVVTTVLDPDARETRNTVAEVYTQIITDLTDAIPLLSDSDDASKFTQWGAKTLLARVYLYKEDNVNAYTTATDIITNGPFSLVSRGDYVDSWGDDFSSESIFTVINSVADNAGNEGVGALSDPSQYGQYMATQDLIDVMRADLDDIRNGILYKDQVSTDDPTTWGRVLKFPGKGNSKADVVNGTTGESPQTNNVQVFRLSEVYLIAAEAGVKGGGANGLDYLEAIVERANPAAVVATFDIDRVLLERRKELVAEGHRLFDLIRNKKDIVRANSIRVWDVSMPLHIAYDNYQVIFPIPRDILNINPYTQNPGYND